MDITGSPPNVYLSVTPGLRINPSQNPPDHIARPKANRIRSNSDIQYTTSDERPASPQPQARQEQMQPTGQMGTSELPRNEGKSKDQIEQNQEKGEEPQGRGPPGEQPRSPNDWRNGLFSCCDDMRTFCMSCWCPCLVYGQNRQRLDHLEENDHLIHGESGIGVDCLMHVAMNTCCALGWVLQLGERGRLRSRHHIAGNAINDCLTAFCCTPCELTQESRELAEEETGEVNIDRQNDT